MGRPAKPWYRAADGWWCAWHEGRQVRLAKGEGNQTAALREFYRLKGIGTGDGNRPPGMVRVGLVIATFEIFEPAPTESRPSGAGSANGRAKASRPADSKPKARGDGRK